MQGIHRKERANRKSKQKEQTERENRKSKQKEKTERENRKRKQKEKTERANRKSKQKEQTHLTHTGLLMEGVEVTIWLLRDAGNGDRGTG